MVDWLTVTIAGLLLLGLPRDLRDLKASWKKFRASLHANKTKPCLYCLRAGRSKCDQGRPA